MEVDIAIRNRKTEKILSEIPFPPSSHRTMFDEILSLGGLAPFHRSCEESHRNSSSMKGIEPWRFHVLDGAGCRRLRSSLPIENAGKIPAMLASADALVMATWLPNEVSDSTPDGEPQFAATLSNMEHIAAASAAIQNLLLAATARNVSNYWSSGGVLRTKSVFDFLQIPTSEILLGAVFLFPSSIGDAERASSKLRQHRGPLHAWARWIELS